MNKKKKNTRIKHRKNKTRVRNLAQISLAKAKPKKIIQTKKVAQSENIEAKDVQKTVAAKKPTAKNTTTKKPAAKKTATKKSTTKKTATKKD